MADDSNSLPQVLTAVDGVNGYTYIGVCPELGENLLPNTFLKVRLTDYVLERTDNLRYYNYSREVIKYYSNALSQNHISKGPVTLDKIVAIHKIEIPKSSTAQS
jgi:hypothetical protein